MSISVCTKKSRSWLLERKTAASNTPDEVAEKSDIILVA